MQPKQAGIAIVAAIIVFAALYFAYGAISQPGGGQNGIDPGLIDDGSGVDIGDVDATTETAAADISIPLVEEDYMMELGEMM